MAEVLEREECWKCWRGSSGGGAAVLISTSTAVLSQTYHRVLQYFGRVIIGSVFTVVARVHTREYESYSDHVSTDPVWNRVPVSFWYFLAASGFVPVLVAWRSSRTFLSSRVMVYASFVLL